MVGPRSVQESHSRVAGRLSRWPLVVLVVLAVTLGIPSPAMARESAAQDVYFLGIPNLVWTDLSPETTPAMWELLGDSAAASLAVRAYPAKTCPDDAWASIGAGNRARSNYSSGQVCPLGSLIGPPLTTTDGTWFLAGENQLTISNAELSFKTTPGLLADLVGCAAAIGPGASVAAAHADGFVDRYRKGLPETAEELAAFSKDCPVTLVDPQTPVFGDEDSVRRAAVAAADEAVAQFIEVVPADAVLIVAGISDAEVPVNLHPIMVRGDGFEDRWLVSAATRRDGYVQLADLGPTMVTLTGGDATGSGMTGQPMRVTNVRPGDTATTVDFGINTNLAGQQIPPMSDGYYSTLTILGLLVIAAAIVLCRSKRRPQRPFARVLLPVALAVGSLPVASLLVNALPWWQNERPAMMLWLYMIGISLALAAIAWWGPWRRHPLGPPAVVATVTALVLGIDCATGTSLQFNSLTGYSAITGARFTGMGNYAFGVYAAAGLMAVLYLSLRLRGWWRAGVITVAAAAAVLVIGLPGWGNDVGGVIALTPAFILAGLHATGHRLSITKILASLAVGATTIGALMVADYLRPADQQTHLGRFVGEILNGSAIDTLFRKGSAALGTITNGPLTLLVIGACVAVPLLWHTRIVNQILSRYPVVLSVGIGVFVVCLLGFAFNDSGIAVPAFTLSVAVPLLVATAARQAILPDAPDRDTPEREKAASSR